jgi:hypothetical protein
VLHNQLDTQTGRAQLRARWLLSHGVSADIEYIRANFADHRADYLVLGVKAALPANKICGGGDLFAP